MEISVSHLVSAYQKGLAKASIPFGNVKGAMSN